MPFQMTHLHIAKNIHQLFPETIKDLSQFYLGTIAPDAVHNRIGYISDYKKASHLCVGDECWGMLTNNDEWIESVLEFLYKNKNSANYNFILGYSCHVLSDIYNNIAVWTPFRLEYPDELTKGYGGLYHQESEKVEIELALREENKDNFWVHLEKAKSISLNNIIYAEEIEKHKENILYNWYKNKEHQDISSNKLVTIESTMNFVEDATNFIVSKIINLRE
jgi:hypothetical protein